MYAVIKTGGKQYRVAPGDTIRIERVDGKVGEKVNFGSVLAVHTDEKKVLVGDDAGNGARERRRMRPPLVERRGVESAETFAVTTPHRWSTASSCCCLSQTR